MLQRTVVLLFMMMTAILNGCMFYNINYHPSNFAPDKFDYIIPSLYGMGGDELNMHRSPLVRYPAYYGQVVGSVSGLPLVLPFAPIYCLYIFSDGAFSYVGIRLLPKSFRNEGALGLMYLPPIALGTTTETVLGVPCWILFGWWWPEANLKKPALPEENKTGHSPYGTENNGTNTKSP